MGDAILGQGITEHGSDYSRRTVNYLRRRAADPVDWKTQKAGREKNESAWRGTATAGTPCIMPRLDACSGTPFICASHVVHLRCVDDGRCVWRGRSFSTKNASLTQLHLP